MKKLFDVPSGPKVYNKRRGNAPEGAVYIGRPSEWGNPFGSKDGTQAKFRVSSRHEAIQAFKEWVLADPNMVRKIKQRLKGKDLVCWCAPAPCHGHVLLKIANED